VLDLTPGPSPGWRSRGLLHGLASGTNWVFRDESMHMAFAFDEDF
jgi:hypothetical protein